MAINGLEALNAFVRAHSESDPYNLIFLDIDMPDIDGNMVLTKIRQWEASKNIVPQDIAKVIMISSHDPETALTNELKPGQESFIAKPLNRNKLAEAFKRVHYI